MSETRVGPYGDGRNQRSSAVPLPDELKVLRTILLDPLPPNANGQAGPFRGSLRSKNLTARNGEIGLLMPRAGGTGVDAVILSPDGDELRRFPTVLRRTTRAEWSRAGTEGRDARAGQFVGLWLDDGRLAFRAGGDFPDFDCLDSVTGDAKEIGTLRATKGTYNQHSYISTADGCQFVLLPPGGHKISGTYLSYTMGGPTMLVGGTCVDMNCWTPLVDEAGVVAIGHWTRPAKSNGCTVTSFKLIMGRLIKQWSNEIPGMLARRSYDGCCQPIPWTMDAERIYLLIHPHDVKRDYPHFDLAAQSELRVISRATGETEWSCVVPGLLTGDQLSCQLSLGEIGLSILAVPYSSAKDGRLVTIDTVRKLVRSASDLHGIHADDFAKAGCTQIYSAGNDTILCAATALNPTVVRIAMPRFKPGEIVNHSWDVAVPACDASGVQLDDFICLDGRAYVLCTYRNGSPTRNGGQLLLILG